MIACIIEYCSNLDFYRVCRHFDASQAIYISISTPFRATIANKVPMQAVLEFSGTLWGVRGCFGTLGHASGDARGRDGTLRDVGRCFGTLKDVLGCSGAL